MTISASEVSQLGLVGLIAISHMSMPNHWLPYFLLGSAQRWTTRRTVALTFAGAFAHVCSTMALIVTLSGLGGAVLSHQAYRTISSLFLVALGLCYLYAYGVGQRRDSCCASSNEKQATDANRLPNGADTAAALSLVTVTALSPCVGSMPVLIAFLKPPLNALRVLYAFLTLLSAAAVAMCTLVALSCAGAKCIDFAGVRRHERLFLGISFIALAALSYYVLSQHSAHTHHEAAGTVVRQGAAVQGGAHASQHCH